MSRHLSKTSKYVLFVFLGIVFKTCLNNMCMLIYIFCLPVLLILEKRREQCFCFTYWLITFLCTLIIRLIRLKDLIIFLAFNDNLLTGGLFLSGILEKKQYTKVSLKLVCLQSIITILIT